MTTPTGDDDEFPCGWCSGDDEHRTDCPSWVPTGPDPARLSASTHQPENERQETASDTGRAYVTGLGTPRPVRTDLWSDENATPPSEPVSLPRQQRDTVQQAVSGSAGESDAALARLRTYLSGEDGGLAQRIVAMLKDLPASVGRHGQVEHVARFLDHEATLAASPGVQGGDGEAPISSEPRSDLISAPGMSSALDADGEARERLARWLWERDGMKPEQWTQARETTREDWRREADLALRAAGSGQP